MFGLIFNLIQKTGYWWNPTIIILSMMFGTVILSVGVMRLNKSLKIPCLLVIMIQLFGSVYPLSMVYDFYDYLPFLYLFHFFSSETLASLSILNLLIFFKVFCTDSRTNLKILISVILCIINVLLLFFFQIKNIMIMAGSLIMINACFIWPDSFSVTSTKLQTKVVDKNKQMTMKDWLLTFIVVALPIVGLFMLLYWVFSNNTNLHKKEWAKAILVCLVIIIIIISVFFGVMFL